MNMAPPALPLPRQDIGTSPNFSSADNGQPDARLVAALRDAHAAAARLRRELAEKNARIAELERAATTDGLTGIANRRGFERDLDGVLSRADRLGEEGMFLYIDLDDFKPVNDELGHAAGDAVLMRVAELLNDCTRPMDLVARLGGDEFAVVLTATPADQGRKRVNRLKRLLNSARLEWNGAEIRIKASVGVRTYGSGDDRASLMERADEAMYNIKRAKQESGFKTSRRHHGEVAVWNDTEVHAA